MVALVDGDSVISIGSFHLARVKHYCSVRDILEHHGGEFLERNLSVSILVHLLDDLLDHRLFQLLSERKHLFDLVSGDGTSTVLVEHFKCSMKLVVGEQVLLVHGGHNELRVVNLTISIGVDLSEHLVNLLLGELSSEELHVSVLNLFLGEFSIAIYVHGSEHLVDLLLLLLAQQLRGDEGKGRLLQL